MRTLNIEVNGCLEKHYPIEVIDGWDFGFGKFIEINSTRINNRNAIAAIRCTLSVDNYMFIEEYNSGPEGKQPHNFVTQDGVDLALTPYSQPVFQNYYNWLTNSDYLDANITKFTNSRDAIITYKTFTNDAVLNW